MAPAPGSFIDANGYPEHYNWSDVANSFRTMLQDERETRVLDVIDKIKEHDLNRELDLPVLIVCGKQSSGKSSVLEAVTRIPFPQGENTCTRFVTEIQLKNADQQSVEGTIRPHGSRSEPEKTRLRRYRSKGGPDQLNDIINTASREMGIDVNPVHRGSPFSQDVLQLIIRGPNFPRLTLVDVPGLIAHNIGKEDEVKIVEEITDSYIMKPNAIILAVVNADADLKDHRIIEKAKLVDPLSERTFGIITKPDRPEAGHDQERTWVKIVQSSPGVGQFKKGAHVLLNRTAHQRVDLQWTLADRDANEEQFFRTPIHGGQNNANSGRVNGWNVLYNTNKWGVDNLRIRLKSILFRHTQNQLGKLEEEIERRLKKYADEIDKVGLGLRDPEALKKLLRDKLAGMSSVADHGSKGTYGHEFFIVGKDARWLRSRIRDESEKFAQNLSESGHNIEYAWAPDTLPPDDTEWIEKFYDFLRTTRGSELPGHVDPARIEVLFKSYSELWHSIAQDFIKQTYDHCWRFVNEVVDYYTKDGLSSMSGRFKTHVIRKPLESRKHYAYEELAAIEEDRRGPLITENVQFWYQSLGKQRDREFYKMNARQQVLGQDDIDGSMGTIQNTPDLAAETNGLYDQESSRREYAVRMINDMIIYYKIARARFIDVVIMQAVQRGLLKNLESLFQSGWMDDQKVFERVTRDPDFAEQLKRMDEIKERMKNLDACLTALRELT